MSALAEITDPHEAVGRAVSLALTAGTWRSIGQVAHLLRARLDPDAAARLAALGMAAADPDDAALVAEVFADPPADAPETFIDTPAGRAALVAWREKRDGRARR